MYLHAVLWFVFFFCISLHTELWLILQFLHIFNHKAMCKALHYGWIQNSILSTSSMLFLIQPIWKFLCAAGQKKETHTQCHDNGKAILFTQNWSLIYKTNTTLLLPCKQWHFPQEMQIKLVLFFSIHAKKISSEYH